MVVAGAAFSDGFAGTFSFAACSFFSTVFSLFFSAAAAAAAACFSLLAAAVAAAAAAWSATHIEIVFEW